MRYPRPGDQFIPDPKPREVLVIVTREYRPDGSPQITRYVRIDPTATEPTGEITVDPDTPTVVE